MTDRQQQDRLEPIVRRLLGRYLGGDSGWRLDPGDPEKVPWIRVFPPAGSVPTQGWKLHVSGGGCNADTVLERIIPLLLQDPAPFKLMSSKSGLDQLNQGAGGEGQAGKFVTVYPHDQTQALRLGTRLDQVTRGLAGPGVATDRPIRPGSLVHYRYGAHTDIHIQLRSGEIVQALATSDGRWEPDRRLAGQHHPPWIEDPFDTADEAAAPANALWAQRYMPVMLLYKSLKGRILLAIDVESPRRCVLKEARRHALLGPDGRDARDALRWEARVLQRLAGRGRFPRFIDLFEHDGALVLAMEDLGGRTLSEVIAQRAKSGRLPSGRQLLDWGLQAADLLAAIHAEGLVYTDLKSSNFLVQSDDRLALVDFELAHPIGHTGPTQGMGTPGYLSAQRLAGRPPVPADDLYGLGAILYFVATGAEPSIAPDRTALNGRRADLLNPDIPAPLLDLIRRCLAPDPGDRPEGMEAVRGILAAADVTGQPAAASRRPEPREAHWRRVALRSGDLLLALVTDLVNGPTPPRPIALGGRHYSSLDINSGLAGGVIALAELYSATGEERFLAGLTGATRKLGELTAESLPLPGFFVGQSGLVTALLWAGRVMGDADLIEHACKRARRLASRIDDSPDLFNGCAGQLRLHLQVARFTDAPGPLDAAKACGERLLATVRPGPRDMPGWEIPADHGGLSGQAPIGYAHGSAGIADALLDLYAITGDPRIADLVTRVAHGLVGAAVPTLTDGTGRDWPPDEGQVLFGAFWCHGAAGVGRFLFNAWQLGLAPDAEASWRGAARSVEQAARWAGPTQCHGIAGSLELLLDLHAQTGEVCYRDAALSLAPVLEAWMTPADSGTGTGAMDWRDNPGFMIGIGGIAACLLRLSGFERAWHPLYPRWDATSTR